MARLKLWPRRSRRWLRWDLAQPGDVLLERGTKAHSAIIDRVTRSRRAVAAKDVRAEEGYSHAAVVWGPFSLFEALGDGVGVRTYTLSVSGYQGSQRIDASDLGPNVREAVLLRHRAWPVSLFSDSSMAEVRQKFEGLEYPGLDELIRSSHLPSWLKVALSSRVGTMERKARALWNRRKLVPGFVCSELVRMIYGEFGIQLGTEPLNPNDLRTIGDFEVVPLGVMDQDPSLLIAHPNSQWLDSINPLLSAMKGHVGYTVSARRTSKMMDEFDGAVSQSTAALSRFNDAETKRTIESALSRIDDDIRLCREFHLEPLANEFERLREIADLGGQTLLLANALQVSSAAEAQAKAGHLKQAWLNWNSLSGMAMDAHADLHLRILKTTLETGRINSRQRRKFERGVRTIEELKTAAQQSMMQARQLIEEGFSDV